MDARSAAPGELETVRTLLNTRWSPTRHGPHSDHLEDIAETTQRWRAELPQIPRPRTRAGLEELREVRDSIRGALTDPTRLQDLLVEHPLVVRVADGPRLSHEPVHTGTVDSLLAVAVEAVATGTWPLLKACGECDWVFYDHSRNASRHWCGMSTPGPDGRNCGSAVKMRNYRARKRSR